MGSFGGARTAPGPTKSSHVPHARLRFGFVTAVVTLAGGHAAAHTLATIDAGRGDVAVLVPDSYVADQAVPLVVSLHGFGGSGDAYVAYWKRNGQVDKNGFIVVAPTGQQDSKGRTYWNATDACCDKDQRGVDDAGYLRGVIEAVEAAYNIDPQSIHVTGYSNGGFMAYRMACDHSDKIASIVSVAGAGFADQARCAAVQPVGVLQVHGLQDPIIRYDGGTLKTYKGTAEIAYPSARSSVAFWAQHNKASMKPVSGPVHDFSDRATGNDTRTTLYPGGAASAELWAIAGEGHVPRFSSAFHEAVVQWMLSRRKASD